ncbi:MAG: hypothetical protein LKG97_00055 [Acetobacter peroxydans]|jgi:hypothetical protein|uniref:hypothetical protein n=3 Tax=Acetobacter peroxydans TaxID=104098 RepID=UPI0023539355|nr:hypothetical protein [Acetobacter peroxydans]MCI1410099.1 hypothetical protein [Acetobacter peroxydans]MCI1566857.1 hypothetical protein [Acetobacter peroxydans]MCI1617786.1 hypothetical protein [Acetobacter peroxydans]MCI1768319.1 hypothetical protein [Acetobacter peroxydans]
MNNFPELTFPEEEKKYLIEAYKQHDIILEYGSGGSTMVAASQKHSLVMTIESDRAWTENIHKLLIENYPQAHVLLQWVDIGPTGDWGWPIDESAWRNWYLYPMGIWNNANFRQPDLVLIDGRFRIGCFIATMLFTKAPITVLWDDYTDRPYYHCIEQYFKPVKTIGRMGVFEITPLHFQPSDIAKFISLVNIPN